MSSISTKTGDLGKTCLGNSERLLKNAPVFQAIGDLDELSSWLGVIVAQFMKKNQENQTQAELLLKIQEGIYIMSAFLAKAKGAGQSKEATLNLSELLKQIEKVADGLDQLPSNKQQKNFLYPGGCELAAWVDVVRTVCRRAERSVVGYFSSELTTQISQSKSSKSMQDMKLIISVLNRLSDYLYSLRCWINYQQGVGEKQLSL